MSSNRDSPSHKSTKRSNKTRKNAAEYQERVLTQVREMFDSILEPDVILSVVQNCNWKLQQSIEHLITLSANISTSNEGSSINNYNADFVDDEQGATAITPDSSPEEDAFEVDTDFTYLNINDEELQKQKDEFKKFESMRKQGKDIIREWPLEEFMDEAELNFAKIEQDTFFSKEIKDDENKSPTANNKKLSQETCGNYQEFQDQEVKFKGEERRKTETESLCGLKVQYRFGGPEVSSDDDADVVIEEESSDHSISISQTTPTNVCQFLSLSTESSPKTTCPQVEMISTASPSSSPSNNPKFKPGFYATINRINSAVEKNVKIMVIIRGLPGSGKSYLANSIVQSIPDNDGLMQFIFSADDFFMKKGRIYDFDPMKLLDAHAFNQRRVLTAVKSENSPIIVDNTNTQCWEMRPYVTMAVQYGYFIEVLEPNTPWAFQVNELAKRNVHGVSRQSIQKMLDRYDRNITGAKLINMFSLKYEPFNMPPQPCVPIQSPKKLKTPSPSYLSNTKKEIKKCTRKNNQGSEAEKKLEDYVPTGFSNATVVDAITNPENEKLTALQLAMKNFGGDDDEDLSPKENNQDLIEDKWVEDGTNWEDERLKVKIKNMESDAFKATLNEDSSSYRPIVVEMAENVKNIHEVNEAHVNLGAIGSERRNSCCEDDLPKGENNQDLIEDKWKEDATKWEDEQLKVKIKNMESNALKATLNEDSSSYRPFVVEMAKNVMNIHDVNDMHLNLGAIGSERKNSIVKNSSVNESLDSDGNKILSKCWDLMLIDDKQQGNVNSENESENENKNKNIAQEVENKDDFENPNNIADSSVKAVFEKIDNSSKSNSSEKRKSPTEELKEAQNTLDKDSPDSGTKSSTTESFENIDSNSEDSLFEIRDATDGKEDVETVSAIMEEIETNNEASNTDHQPKVSFESIMKFIKKSILGANNDASNKDAQVSTNELSKTSETVIDSLTEKLHSPVKEYDSRKMEKFHIETNSDSDSNDTLTKKLLDICREPQNENKLLVCENQGNFKCVEFEEELLIATNNDIEISKNSDSFINISSENIKENFNDLDIENQLACTLSESKDNLEDIYSELELLTLTGPLARTVLSLEENEKLILEEKQRIKSKERFETEDLEAVANITSLPSSSSSSSSSRKESPHLTCEISNKVEKSIKTETTSQCFQEIDNVNLISWKESPFPTCGVEIPVNLDESKEIMTSEASTNTNFYDFNVLFIGGTSEPEYQVLDAFNRSINEKLVPSNNVETPPPRKLKLDKSSMTNEVDVLLQLPNDSDERVESDTEIIQGLIDMFPHIPKDYIIDVYKNLCKGNSDWAAEVLLDGIPTGADLKAEPLKPVISESTLLNSSPNRKSEKLKQSTSSDSSENLTNTQNRKKDKFHLSEDSLALKKHLEEKVMINEASYHPHILRVRKWKHGEPDVSTEEIIEAQTKNKQVLQFVNDLNPAELQGEASPTKSDELKEIDESDEDDPPSDTSEPEETVEFNLGWEFIKNLESQVGGNTNFQIPDGLFPAIQLKKSMAEEIYALWIESMQQQMDAQQTQLDAMIKKDAEYAKSLEEAEAKAIQESVAPNLNEVMDMELALAVYNNDLKKQQARETPVDMASRLTRQMLNEMFPNTDPETLSEILKAHDGNFKETVQVLEVNTGQSLSSSDTLNKQNSLIMKVKQQSLSKEDVGKSLKSSSSKSVEIETGTDELTYEQVLETARESREEAGRQFLLRNENFNKASSAYRRGNSAVASYYSQMAKLHSQKMESANSAAASAFLAAQAHVLSKNNTLDLHNLFVPEALQALDIFLDHQLQRLSSGNKRSVEILIITGRGARSNNNKSKIKPAVSKRLTSRNISFTEENPGCLKAKLYRYNAST